MAGPLGRLKPPDREHVKEYRLTELIEDQRTEYVVPKWGTYKALGLPSWWKTWDQGSEGACVGYGSSTMMSVTNRWQNYLRTGKYATYKYNPRWLYFEAQKNDPWPGGAYPDSEEFYEGTTVNAACKVLKNQGHIRVINGVDQPLSVDEGISAYRWAVTVDEMRAALWANCAISIGVDWYSNFDNPKLIQDPVEQAYWIGVDSSGNPLPKNKLGFIRGGHCVGIFRYSDKRKGFRFMNSWGSGYPPCWIPYSVMQILLDDQGEAAVITDR